MKGVGITKKRSKFLYSLLGLCVVAFFLSVLGEDKAPAAKPTVKETIELKGLPVKFDKSMGASVARIGVGRLHQIDATLVEIPPGGKLEPHKHLAEEMIYIVSGKGYSVMWMGTNGKKEKYEWSEGDLLSPTLNAWHQHFNASSDQPARFLSVTTAPLVENVFHNPAFLSSSDFLFQERWQQAILGKPEYVTNVKFGPTTVRMTGVGHLLPNLNNRPMKPQIANLSGENSPRNKETGITIVPEGDMVGNQLLEADIREFMKMGATSPSHRHVWEVVYVVLKGEGRSTLQREGEPERQFDWKAGDSFIIEPMEYHNHVPLGRPGGRLLQIKATGYFRRLGLDNFLYQNKPKNGGPAMFASEDSQ